MLWSNFLDDTVERIREKATSARMPVGAVKTSVADAKTAADDGYQILLVGGEISSAREVLGEKLSALR